MFSSLSLSGFLLRTILQRNAKTGEEILRYTDISLNDATQQSNFTTSKTTYTATATQEKWRNGIYLVKSSSVYDNSLNYSCEKPFNSPESATYWASDASYGTSSTDISNVFVYSGTEKTTVNKGVYPGVTYPQDISGEWVQVQLPFNLVLKNLKYTGDTVDGSMPVLVYLVASKNGSTWYNFGFYTGTSNSTADISLTNNEEPFSYYRIIVQEIHVNEGSSLDNKFACLKNVVLES